jgi:type II secretory pathway component PulM
MGRTPASTTDATPEPREPEIMRSAMLANIITLELVAMIDEAAKRYEAEQQGRRMAATLAAVRGMVRDVRALHALPAIDWTTGEPSSNGTEPAEATS